MRELKPLQSILTLLTLFLILTVSVQTAEAVLVFTDWTSFTGSSSTAVGDGVAAGTLTIGSNVVTINYAGDLRDSTGMTTIVDGTDTTFNRSTITPPLTFSDAIANDGGVGLTHTLTFSQPLVDPTMHIVSLGRAEIFVDFDFSESFTIISSNPNLTNPSGNILRGNEGEGTVQFIGNISSLSWVSSAVEQTMVFQLGAEQVVPEPSTLALAAFGLLSLGLYGWRRKRA